MKEETKLWLKKAKEDLDTARYNFNGGKYEIAAFLCQQAAEKAMKALMLEESNRLIKTHDLVILARKLKAPKEIEEHAKELTLAYVYARYPDVPEIKDIKGKAQIFLEYANSVIKWIENLLRISKNSEQE